MAILVDYRAIAIDNGTLMAGPDGHVLYVSERNPDTGVWAIRLVKFAGHDYDKSSVMLSTHGDTLACAMESMARLSAERVHALHDLRLHGSPATAIGNSVAVAVADVIAPESDSDAGVVSLPGTDTESETSEVVVHVSEESPKEENNVQRSESGNGGNADYDIDVNEVAYHNFIANVYDSKGSLEENDTNKTSVGAHASGSGVGTADAGTSGGAGGDECAHNHHTCRIAPKKARQKFARGIQSRPPGIWRARAAVGIPAHGGSTSDAGLDIGIPFGGQPRPTDTTLPGFGKSLLANPLYEMSDGIGTLHRFPHLTSLPIADPIHQLHDGGAASSPHRHHPSGSLVRQHRHHPVVALAHLHQNHDEGAAPFSHQLHSVRSHSGLRRYIEDSLARHTCPGDTIAHQEEEHHVAGMPPNDAAPRSGSLPPSRKLASRLLASALAPGNNVDGNGSGATNGISDDSGTAGADGIGGNDTGNFVGGLGGNSAAADNWVRNATSDIKKTLDGINNDGNQISDRRKLLGDLANIINRMAEDMGIGGYEQIKNNEVGDDKNIDNDGHAGSGQDAPNQHDADLTRHCHPSRCGRGHCRSRARRAALLRHFRHALPSIPSSSAQSLYRACMIIHLSPEDSVQSMAVVPASKSAVYQEAKVVAESHLKHRPGFDEARWMEMPWLQMKYVKVSYSDTEIDMRLFLGDDNIQELFDAGNTPIFHFDAYVPGSDSSPAQPPASPTHIAE